MPRIRKPRCGSLQYWPRKRAKRIYPKVGHVTGKGVLAFAGWKAGMIHVGITDQRKGTKTFGKTINKAATVIETPSLFVCGIRFYDDSKALGEKWADNLPKELSRKGILNPGSSEPKKEPQETRLIVATQPQKSGMKKKKPDVFEVPIEDDKIEDFIGKEIDIADVFNQGDFLDVKAVTKGYGFTGPVKRFGIKIQGRKNEQHHRHVGSIGSVVPRKLDWRVPAAGQHGYHTRTEYNKQLVEIGETGFNEEFEGYGLVKGKYIAILGSVPGPQKRLVILQKARRTKKKRAIELKYKSKGEKNE